MSTELGTLVVVVLKARNLIDNHFYKQDVYTKVTLNGMVKQTKVDVKGGQHPEWDDELRIPVQESTKKAARTLEVVCWSKEPRTDEVVGKGEVDITETLKTGEFDDWIPLTTSDGKQRGEVYLEMTFYAAGPPPALSRRPSKLDPATRLTRIQPGGTRPLAVHHPGLQAVLTPQNGAHLTPTYEPHAGRSPHREPSPLPPLPEEAGVPPPAALPAILRPGTGRPGSHSPQPSTTRLHSSPEASPRMTHQAYPSTSASTPRPQSSLDATPAILRVGGGRAHTQTPSHHTSPSPHRMSPHSSEPPLPPLPGEAQASTYVPVSSPEPVAHQSYTPAPQPYASIPALPSTPHPAPTPVYSPAPAQTPTPSHSYSHSQSNSQSSSWYQPQPTHTRTDSQPHLQPQHQQPPPLQPSTYSVDPVPAAYVSTPTAYTAEPGPAPEFPSFSFPAPQVLASQPAYTQPSRAYSPYPPSQPAYPPNPPVYPPNQPSYPPSQPTYSAHQPYPAAQPGYYPYQPAPSPAHPHGPPQTNGRPYPYNYAPPPRDPDLDAPDYLNKPRYQKPLPLPDEPAGAGVKTPTPAHPHQHSHPSSASNSHSNSEQASSHQHRHTSSHGSNDARDKRTEYEREEEARREREKARLEQEERDRDLARKLDMELNLGEMEEEGAPLQNADMPGGWDRRVEV